jgi:hypothetical protein
MAQNEPTETRYRCGWCGHPTDETGQPVEFDSATVEDDYKDAGKVHGLCCPPPEDPWQPQHITREMAMDAGDPSMEGMIW